MKDAGGQNYPLDSSGSRKARNVGLSAIDVYTYQEAGITDVLLMCRAVAAGLDPWSALQWGRVFSSQLEGTERTLEMIVHLMEHYSLTYRDVLDYRSRSMPRDVQEATIDSLDALNRNGLTPRVVSCFVTANVMSVDDMWTLQVSGVTGPDAVGFWSSGIADPGLMLSLTSSVVRGQDWYYFVRAGRTPDEMRDWMQKGVDGSLAYACASLLGRTDLWFAHALTTAGMTGDALYEYMREGSRFGDVRHWLHARTRQVGPGMSPDIAAVIHDRAAGRERAADGAVRMAGARFPVPTSGAHEQQGIRPVMQTAGSASPQGSPAGSWPQRR